MKKAYLGGRLRQLREARGLTQAALAAQLGISPSYLNQIERNQRPLTVQVLLKINAAFGLDIQVFSEEGDARVLAELREALQGGEPAVGAADLRDLVDNAPALARRMIALHRRAREAEDRAAALALAQGAPDAMPAPAPFEEVRDFFYDNRNFFDGLDTRAEDLARAATLAPGEPLPGLAAHLRDRHGIALRRGEDETGDLRRFDPGRRELLLSGGLSPGQMAFQAATQIGLIEAEDEIARLVAGAAFSGDEARRLARIGLANYFAGAVLMPYEAIWRAAEQSGYDIGWLGHRFGTGFEATCHRLSTLQRPGRQGVPFFFLRVDRAGNISKRQSATDFHFSKVGGSCPLWRVHSAFDRPGEILTQIAEMPEGRRYFWVTRMVQSRRGRYGSPGKVFAVALGCDIAHAGRLVYSQGLDLGDPAAVTPIGAGCKICPREECSQRAFPMLGRPLAANPGRAQFSPYAPAQAPSA
ncbi:Cro/Cl family transcriptional regulator [Rhodovulum sp. BSW8]|uniref:short-chain fatty acyl-CoA regulator family protein n=1 Tax=Rhodovulum sp. BSW8 TaxID=2259645 RepID=UPI000DE1C584|nr:short-chain fatty acyl-CoA regulator family protein [Rhodovulum sp. BSW8]RBO53838.1 Cro/Cl family transcriptional regulator [Rhodovulum sp. BSW8]